MLSDAFFVPETLAVLMVVAVGLVIGSFLNVVIYRLPAGLSTVYPGSRCSRCLLPVKPWDNVPVLSYLWLRARCRSCRASISIRYPLVELLTATLFWLSAWRFGERPVAVAASCGLVTLLIVLGLIDWDHRRVPMLWVLGGLVVGPVVAPLFDIERGAALWAGSAGGLGMAVLSLGWKFFTGAQGFGPGDIWVVAMIGTFTGPEGILVSWILAAVLALFWTITRRKTPNNDVPFVTFLSTAALAVHFWP